MVTQYLGHIVEERDASKCGGFQDLTGKVYDQLTVEQLEGVVNTPGYGAVWRCRCDCGREVLRHTGFLNYRSSQSCGKNKTHGYHVEYEAWKAIGQDVMGFCEFIRTVGPRPSRSSQLKLERGRLRWSVIGRAIVVDGVELSLSGWARRFGVSREYVRKLTNKHGGEQAIRYLMKRAEEC